MIKAWNRQDIVDLWNQGYSAFKVIEQLGLDITARQVQRIGAEYGSRKLRASGRLLLDDNSRVGVLRDIIVQLMDQSRLYRAYNARKFRYVRVCASSNPLDLCYLGTAQPVYADWAWLADLT